MQRENRFNLFMILLGAIYCLVGFAVVVFGRHHVDEGYYHLIAHLTGHGKLPYRDYFYVQTPLFPLVYGVLFKFIGSSLFMARGLSLIFSISTFLLAVRIAENHRGKTAGAITALLILSQPFTLYYLGIVKLYALTALLLTILVGILNSKIKATWRYPLASVIAALAIATRLTTLPGLPVVIFLGFCRTRHRERLITVTKSIIFGALTLLICFIPFLLISPETFGYSVLGYHLDKEGFSLFRQVSHRIDAISRLCRLYLPVISLLLVSLVFRFRSFSSIVKWFISREKNRYADGVTVMVSIILFHFTSQAPYVHRYLAMTLPAIAALLGPEILYLGRSMGSRISFKHVGIGSLCCLLTIAGLGQSELDISTQHNPVAELHSIASEISMITAPGDEILTFNNSIAVEAGRSVLPGDEMNVLTYHPQWTRERCELFHVLNVDMLEEAIVSCRLRALLISKYSFIGNFPTFYNPGERGARPRIMSAIEKHYHCIGRFPEFGYMGEEVQLYLPVRKANQSDLKFGLAPSLQIYRKEE